MTDPTTIVARLESWLDCRKNGCNCCEDFAMLREAADLIESQARRLAAVEALGRWSEAVQDDIVYCSELDAALADPTEAEK